MPATAQQTGTFAAATAAFEQGDYPQALGLFQQARAEGVDSAALNYNIGVCQYRIGDYTEAERTFRSLAERFPQLRALAEYNRGLALSALERTAEAATVFEGVRAAGDERLAALAASALAELDREAAAPAPAWFGYLNFGVGHDDNVALLDDLSLPAAVSASSALHELLGYASHRFALRVPLRLDFSGYLVRYPDAAQFDQDAWNVDMAFEWSPGAWRLGVGPHLGLTTLDGDGFESSIGAGLRATRSLSSRLSFDLRYWYDDIESPTTRFDYMTGTRQRVRFALERRTPDGRGRVRVGYEIDLQDRAAPSVSPERGRIALNFARRVQERWSVEGLLAYRQSGYDELAVPRDEQLVEIAAVVRRELSAAWLLNVEYRWADNDADVAQYSYTSNRFSVGVSRSF
jgi:hypothetical protein